MCKVLGVGSVTEPSVLYLPRVDDERDVTVHVGGEPPEGADDLLLSQEPVRVVTVRPHHELQVVHDHVRDVVHIHRVRHGLKELNSEVCTHCMYTDKLP